MAPRLMAAYKEIKTELQQVQTELEYIALLWESKGGRDRGMTATCGTKGQDKKDGHTWLALGDILRATCSRPD